MHSESYPPAIPVNASSLETNHSCGWSTQKWTTPRSSSIRRNGSRPDGTSDILRVTQDGQPAANPLLG
jgi:hypothetical protein